MCFIRQSFLYEMIYTKQKNGAFRRKKYVKYEKKLNEMYVF